MNQEVHLFCSRCGRELTPGKGDFFVVNIEAVADPHPPRISRLDLESLASDALAHAIEQTQGSSERELMDQVYRHLSIHLCGPCYRRWIEDPAGQDD